MPTARKRTNTTPGRGILAVVLACALLVALIGLHFFAQPQSPAYNSPLAENPYSAGDFVSDGGYLTCTAGNAVLGIDVSSHQGEIDWAQVADAGMEFAMIRIGFRGYTYGSISPDEWAAANLAGAKAAGLKVGVYFFSQATSPKEAAEEAQFCIDFLQDYALDLPVVFDWEYVSRDARTGSVDKETLTECTLSFCRTIESAGYEAMIYFNPDIANRLLDLPRLSEYPFWLAQYSAMDFPYAVDMWQYTQNGKVPGITGDMDIDLWFTD